MKKKGIGFDYAQRWKVTAVAIVGLAIMATAVGTVFAGSGSGAVDSSSSDTASLFLGFCPGAPCADVELKLDGDRLQVSATGFGFPLDPDLTGRLNHYGLCVENRFVDDDLVESENRRAVFDDGQVNVDGEARIAGLNTLLGVEVKIYIGEDEPNRAPLDQICGTGPLLLAGIVEFRNLR